MTVRRKHYTGVHLFWDVILTLCSGGLWLIWIFIRAMRSIS